MTPLQRLVLPGVLAATMVLGIAVPGPVRAHHGTVTVAAPEAAARPNPLGVHLASLYEGGPVRRRAVLDRIANADASWIRIDIGWASLEAEGRGRYADWYVRLIDNVLREADRRGLRVLAMFWTTPAWANGGEGTRALPTDVADYARALRWAASRWGRTIDAWEIWNEPNSDRFLVGGSPARYARLLCAAYRRVKAVDSSPVLTGGLEYNDESWLRRLYQAGGRGCFDAVATHPYVAPSDAPPEARDVGEIWRLTHTPAVRRVMRHNGDGGKRIWMTEIGWSTGISDDPDPWDQGVTKRVQASFLKRAIRLVRDRYRYVGPIFWYRDVDGRRGDVHEDGFGLLRRNLKPKPALRAFRIAANR